MFEIARWVFYKQQGCMNSFNIIIHTCIEIHEQITKTHIVKHITSETTKLKQTHTYTHTHTHITF